LRNELVDHVSAEEILIVHFSPKLSHRLSRCGGSRSNEDRRQRALDSRGNMVLQCEHVGELTIEAVAPELESVPRVDELCAYSHAVPGAPYAALEHVRHAQADGDGAQVADLALESKCRRARHDTEAAQRSKSDDDLLGNPVHEMDMVRIGAQVLEWEHRNARPVR
jgi:hypothetical protein